MRGIVWFREDLRLKDNTALFHAIQKCTSGVLGVYIIDPAFWMNHHMANCRIEFLLRGLQILKENLEKKDIPLIIKKVKNTKEISTEILELAIKIKAESIFFNRQYEINEKKRDDALKIFLKKQDIICYDYDDQVILPPGSVLTPKGEFYKVFTPFKKRWQQILQEKSLQILHIPKVKTPLHLSSSLVPKKIAPFHSKIDPALWPSGENAALKKLMHFIEHPLFFYDKTRDFPALEGTSQLSPYLSCGMISPRICFNEARRSNHEEVDTGNKGAVTWMNELIWREFYKHLLVFFPKLSMEKPFQEKTDKIAWSYHKKHLLAWQQGETGFPIVDAAMRQLNQTGWMHNRLRMIVAMFLTKNLLIDWRLGETYFIEHLIDGDLAANNGGWQWCASTGTDAAPYFRIFNTVTQSERFDPDGTFIKKYCPELEKFDKRTIHAPFTRQPLLAKKAGYPKPLIDLKLSRKRAIDAFKKI
jgi:deoxyribodipyrimidine photo-lyase